jgi:hypothetical protein
MIGYQHTKRNEAHHRDVPFVPAFGLHRFYIRELKNRGKQVSPETKLMHYFEKR